ncbi:dimethylarginine dimethylaminohydrolase family protein [Halobacillus mangrovi]|uniref:N-dimethylarginine dimethylaminohydrolase n=1 Tax=Halobacillus mangrovi TaxID=402384 RepID=A0A1W5ZYX4_9BACI|nr:arginine deiminase family protein [Halobacillus mangrovi]ARI78469.1 hypothetical protein HM131_17215 [Halobacillus mangrovi]
MKGIAAENSIHCETEYSVLKRVIVVKPAFMKINEVINETQKHYEGTNIDIPLAIHQHKTFVNTLKEHHVDVCELPTEPDLPEQVFTRDIAFTIYDQLFIASMGEEVRQNETEILKSWLQKYGLPFHEGFSDSIEGGDVVIDGTTIWVGKSGRTSYSAIEELQSRLPSHKIEPLSLTEDILHLDCVFNIINDDTALLYPPAFTSEDLRKIKSQFHIINVTEDEKFHMGPNVLSIGNKKIISLSQNKRLNGEIESQGFQVIPVDFSEIIKSGGAFRCCTLPLQRQ